MAQEDEPSQQWLARRDYFAAKFLHAKLSRPLVEVLDIKLSPEEKQAVDITLAVTLADALIAELDKG